jgi:hypothetical protein
MAALANLILLKIEEHRLRGFGVEVGNAEYEVFYQNEPETRSANRFAV